MSQETRRDDHCPRNVLESAPELLASAAAGPSFCTRLDTTEPRRGAGILDPTNGFVRVDAFSCWEKRRLISAEPLKLSTLSWPRMTIDA